MKNNTARDIKAAGTLMLVLAIISSIIIGIITMIEVPLVGIIIIAVGCISAFIPYLLFIGFAEIIEKLTQIELNTRGVKLEKQSSKREITNKEETKNTVEEEIENIVEEVAPQKGKWICPECCREINNEENKCKCGYEKK